MLQRARVLVVFFSVVVPVPDSAAYASACEQERIKFSQALGVLLYENIVSDYVDHLSIEQLTAGLMHANGHPQFKQLTSDEVELSVRSKSGTTGSDSSSDGHKMTVTAAQKVVDDWRIAPESRGRRFTESYRDQADTTEEQSGLLWREIGETPDPFQACMDKLDVQGNNSKRVCYSTVDISENAVCDPVVERQKATTGNNMSYGHFQQKEVIPGWAEAFNIVDDLQQKQTDKHPVLVEVVVPPHLGYGGKGVPGKVESNETLWFVMFVD